MSKDLSGEIDVIKQLQSEQHQNLSDEIAEILHSIYENERSFNEKLEVQEKEMSRKVNIAYAIGGGFGAVSLIHLVLNALGVL